jgi:hypothetical protein
MPAPALAHSNEYLASMKGAHGGWLRMSGPYHLELVVDEENARVWVTDHADQPQSTVGARAQLMFMQGGKRIMVTLTPGDGNVLEGRAQGIGKSDVRAVLTLEMAGQAPLQVRFSPPQATVVQDVHHGH